MGRTLFEPFALFHGFEEVGVVVEQEYRIDKVLFSRGEIAERISDLANRKFFSYGTNDLTQMTFGFSKDDAGKFLNKYKK